MDSILQGAQGQQGVAARSVCQTPMRGPQASAYHLMLITSTVVMITKEWFIMFLSICNQCKRSMSSFLRSESSAGRWRRRQAWSAVGVWRPCETSVAVVRDTRPHLQSKHCAPASETQREKIEHEQYRCGTSGPHHIFEDYP